MHLSKRLDEHRFADLCGLNPAELEAVIIYRNEQSDIAADDALWEHFVSLSQSDVIRLHKAGMPYRKIYQFYPHYRRAEWLDFDGPGRQMWKLSLLARVQPAIFQKTQSEESAAINKAIQLLMKDDDFLNLLSDHHIREADWVRWIKEVDGVAAINWVNSIRRYPELAHTEIHAMLWGLAFFHVTFATNALCLLVEELSIANPMILEPHFFHVMFDLLQRRAITEPAIHELRFFLTSLRVTQNQAKLSEEDIKQVLILASRNMREAKRMILMHHADALNRMQRAKRQRANFSLIKK